MLQFIQKNRGLTLLTAIIILGVALPFGWWLASPLWRTDEVNEEFPFDLPTVAEAQEMSGDDLEDAMLDVMDQVDEMTEEEREAVEEQIMELSAVMPDKAAADDMMEEEWVVAEFGMFRDADPFHQGSGDATIFQQGDQRILRLENFEVTNGPDLHVLLVENVDGTNTDEIGEYVDLGSLKGNVGNQNYEIPADLDLSQYSGVMIYCVPFHVVFSTAPFGG